MTSLARTERDALCDLALQLGADHPTLSGDWTIKDLVVHLLVREGSPAAVGIKVPLLAKLTDAASHRLRRRDFQVLVERLRSGPPFYSPFRIPKADALLNTLEFFVHHEDVRRAQPTWLPRTLARRQEDLLCRQVSVAGKRLVRDAEVGVSIERSDTGKQTALRSRDRTVVVRGLPSEVTLYVYGRKEQARVDLDGAEADVTALHGTGLRI